MSGPGLWLACSIVCVCREREEESSWKAEHCTFWPEQLCPCMCWGPGNIVTLLPLIQWIPNSSISPQQNSQQTTHIKVKRRFSALMGTILNFLSRILSFAASRWEEARHVPHLPEAVSCCGVVFQQLGRGWGKAEWSKWKPDLECQGYSMQFSSHVFTL